MIHFAVIFTSASSIRSQNCSQTGLWGLPCTRWLQHDHDRSPMCVGFDIDRVVTTEHYIYYPPRASPGSMNVATMKWLLFVMSPFLEKKNCCLIPLWLIDRLTKSWIGLDQTQVASQRILSVGPAEEGMGLPYELLNGRAGFLYAALFLNHHIGPDVVPWSITVSQVLTMSYKSHTWRWPTQNDDQRIIDIYLFLFLANGSLTSDDDLFHLVTVNWASSDLGVTNTS